MKIHNIEVSTSNTIHFVVNLLHLIEPAATTAPAVPVVELDVPGIIISWTIFTTITVAIVD